MIIITIIIMIMVIKIIITMTRFWSSWCTERPPYLDPLRDPSDKILAPDNPLQIIFRIIRWLLRL